MKSGKTIKIARLGLLFAMTVVLSIADGLITPSVLPVGVKPGLSNITVMYTLLYMNIGSAAGLILLKAAFALLTRGVTAGVLALCGGVLSGAVMLALIKVGRGKASLLTISVCGAVAHNLSQLAMAALLTGTPLTLYYYPVLLLAGLAAGAVTGALLKAVIPALSRIHIHATPQANSQAKDNEDENES